MGRKTGPLASKNRQEKGGGGGTGNCWQIGVITENNLRAYEKGEPGSREPLGRDRHSRTESRKSSRWVYWDMEHTWRGI